MSKKVLVIDDDPAIGKAFTLSLEDTEYQVDTAESGERGIEMLRECEYNLIYLDLRMPGMNGVETLREIRKMDKNIIIYIITAFHFEYFDQLTRASKDGLDFELLRKPVGNEQIVEVTRGVLNAESKV